MQQEMHADHNDSSVSTRPPHSDTSAVLEECVIELNSRMNAQPDHHEVAAAVVSAVRPKDPILRHLFRQHRRAALIRVGLGDNDHVVNNRELMKCLHATPIQPQVPG